MIAGAVLSTAAGVAIAKTIVVQPHAVEVTAEMSTDSDPIEVVQPNQTLEVVGESGAWLKVKTASGKIGYIPKAIVSRSSSGAGVAARGLTGVDAAQAGAAAAGKGLTEEAARYAHSQSYRTDGPDRMAAMRQKYHPELKSFKNEGQVGKTN
jgi:hypothetical protein